MAREGEGNEGNANGEERGNAQHRSGLWQYVPPSHIANALATIFLVIVGMWGICETRGVLQRSQRAWISVLGARLLHAPEKGQAISFVIDFENTGHEPALDVNTVINNSTIPAFDPTLTDRLDVKLPQNTACDGVNPIKDYFVVAPQLTPGFTSVTLNSVHGIPAIQADEKLIDLTNFYIVTGCVAYKTFDAPHHTAFCYILEGIHTTEPAHMDMTVNPPAFVAAHPIVARQFATCGKGFYAD